MNGADSGERGAALVLVLIAGCLLGLIGLAASFTVTLDSLAARRVQEAAQAEGQVEGALQVAAAEATGAMPVPDGAVLGPWPAADISCTVNVKTAAGGALQLYSTATVGQSSLSRTMVLRGDAEGSPTVVARE